MISPDKNKQKSFHLKTELLLLFSILEAVQDKNNYDVFSLKQK